MTACELEAAAGAIVGGILAIIALWLRGDLKRRDKR
jgi:hypothetical protein